MITNVLGAAALAATSAGCAIGGRLTGGVLADHDGASGFVAATFEIGAVDRTLARLTPELGGTVSETGTATHVGVRYAPSREGRRGWTVSAAGEGSDAGGFAIVTGGVSIAEPSVSKETPDTISGLLFGADVEAVLAFGGDAWSALYPRVGAQISLELLDFTLMR